MSRSSGAPWCSNWLSGCPKVQRRVIELRYVEEKSLHEVAEELGRTEGAVKQLQRRALETLRADWEASHG